MKKLMTLFAAVALVGSLAHAALAADTLTEVKKKGVLVVG
jgi:polar amino acid transport system substrate-binding protein